MITPCELRVTGREPVSKRSRVLLLAVGMAIAPAWGLSRSPPAAPPATDIYLVPLRAGLGSMAASAPSPVSVAPGYDNQPMFSPDGGRILFAANRDGKQIDVSRLAVSPKEDAVAIVVAERPPAAQQ